MQQRASISEQTEWKIEQMSQRIGNLTLKDNKEKIMKKSEESLCDIQDSIRHTNIRITGVPEGKERDQRQKSS